MKKSQEYQTLRANLINAGRMDLAKDLEDTQESIEFHEALLALEMGQSNAVQDETAQDDNTVGNGDDAAQDDNTVGNEDDASPQDDTTTEQMDLTLGDVMESVHAYIFEGETFEEKAPEMGEYLTNPLGFVEAYTQWQERQKQHNIDNLKGIERRFNAVISPIAAEIKTNLPDVTGLYFDFDNGQFRIVRAKHTILADNQDKRSQSPDIVYRFGTKAWTGRGLLPSEAIEIIKKDNDFKGLTDTAIRNAFSSKYKEHKITEETHKKVVSLLESYKV